MSPRALTSTLATTLAAAAVACSPGKGERVDTGQIDTAGVAADSTSSSAAEARSAPAKPNQQMQAVLDELAALHPKPITELSAPAARKQPSPADAVKALAGRRPPPRDDGREIRREPSVVPLGVSAATWRRIEVRSHH